MRRLLVVDDDPNMHNLVRMYLERGGYEVLFAKDGASALRAAVKSTPDLVILDIMMPGMDGYEVLRRLKAGSDVPVIFLTCKDDDLDTVVGLEMGADDYMTKPFSPRELIARVRAVLRRASAAPPDPAGRLCVAGLTIDRRTWEASAGGAPLKLTPKEFDILWLLASHPRVVFSREEIMGHVWGYDPDYEDVRTVDTHVKRLRKKLSEAGSVGCTIEAVWGRGYRFVATASNAKGEPAPDVSPRSILPEGPPA
jgi:two-component system response regulator ResD